MAMGREVHIVIARHLPTKANEGKERLRGWGDDGIDEEVAEKLAPQMAAVMDKEGVDCLYCSTLTRGLETAQAIIDCMTGKCEITGRPQMKTWDTGRYTGKLRDDVWSKIESYIKNPEIPVPGDERF